MLWCRYKEEIIQTKLEMHQYLKSLLSVRSALESKIEIFQKEAEEPNLSPDAKTLLKGKALLAGVELHRIIRKELDALAKFKIDPSDSQDVDCLRFDVTESPDLVVDDDGSANNCSDQVDASPPSDEDDWSTSSETDCEYSEDDPSDEDLLLSDE